MPIKLSFDGIIGEAPNDAASVRAALRKGGAVTVSINSPGGIATEGLAIYNLLNNHPARVDVTVDSIALSAGSLIAMAGDRITMREGALMMIHDPSGVTIGPASAHEKSRDTLDKMAGEFAKIYAQRTGLSEDEARTLMLEETWMNSTEAVDLGFAEAASSEGATASAPAFDYRMFKHAPATLLALAPPKSKARKSSPMKKPVTAAAAASIETDDEPTVDVTADILNRAATAKLSAAEAADIVLQAKGSLDTARDLIIDAVAKQRDQGFVPSAVGQSAGGDEDGHSKALGEAFSAKLAGKSATGAFAGMTSVGLASEWLRARGLRPPSNDATSIVMAAFGARRPTMVGGGFHTTSDFPTILGDSMQKSLAALFTASDTGVGQIAGVGTMPDFRTKTIGKLSSFPALLPVAESGEITFGTLEEAGEKISVGTFARAISVSLQVLVNDNLGAVQRSIRDIAFGAVNLKASLILTAMLTAQMQDGKTLFHADHSNTIDNDKPTVASLSAMRAAMRQQTALDGSTVLGLAPKVILVPSALETAAQIIAAAIQPTSPTDVNPFAGGVVVAAEPRLDAVSTQVWYGFADPAVMPAVEFDTLESTPIPKLEIADPADFARLGSAYRVWWAAGASPVESRAAVRNTGATEPA
jgi:ATP-dependent protease ClpP protease subunit